MGGRIIRADMAKGNRSVFILLLVLSGAIISICMGLRQSLGLFMRPMAVDTGISAATFGFAIALQNIVWGLAQPFVGAAADRYGPRPVLVGTAVLYASGLVLMAFSQGEMALDIAGFLLGVGTAGTAFGVLMGVVTRATPESRRSQTVGLVAAAGGAQAEKFKIFLSMSYIGNDWQAALLAFAGIAASMVVLALPIKGIATQLGADAPARTARAQGLGAALREALGHRGYLCMTLAFFACGFQLVFITTHLPAYLQLCGVNPGVSATALGLIGLFNTIGTWCFGQLGARYSQKRLLALIYLLRTLFICVFLWTPISAASTLVFAAAMGMLWLGVSPLVTGILGRVFGLSHFGTLYGVVFLSHQVGSFLGAWMGGVVYARTGSYDAAWAALVAVGLTAFTLQWLMDDRPPAEIRRGAGAMAAA